MHNFIPTGNEYLSIPTIRESDGAIESINIALMQLDGLLEFCGPWGKPFLSVPACAGPLKWNFREGWIPESSDAQGRNHGLILAPPGERFMIYQLLNRTDGTHFTISLGDIYQTANIRHRLPRVDFVVQPFSWGYEQGVVINLFIGPLVASLSLRSPGGAKFEIEDGQGRREFRDGLTTTGPLILHITCDKEPVLVIGAGLSSVGAMSANLEVGRVNAGDWLARTEAWLRVRRAEVPNDPVMSEKANRNGHFARFFAMARTLDTDEAVSMTSRSHRYYVSSAYWDRDSLLWLFPFLLRNDKNLAADLLRYAFGRQLAHTGIHSRYISGRILEYGFELDELLAPLVALAGWIQVYPDDALPEDDVIRKGVLFLLKEFRKRRHPEVALYSTELMPTDDRINDGRIYLTYNNALAIHALNGLIPLLEKSATAESAFAREEIRAIRNAIRGHCIKDNEFLWSTDLKGNTEFYDEAAGSLSLLTYYGFCSKDDPVYQNTIRHLYSDLYPYLRQGTFSELGNRHTDTPHPWVLSACSSVLGGVRTKEGLDFLRRAPMDFGIACESVNVDTGYPETGLHFATCAGFVAHAILSGTKYGK